MESSVERTRGQWEDFLARATAQLLIVEAG
jgi:hypothetical protein